ncbi:hypothetical protein C7C46_11710 [Streptomyces tateyamensis]|uniref:Aminodeoxyfutalosine deaminase/Imidazolonepropionase-like composite domain-containing protein n=1 Tax=Streptomyces tateyamensis TaxID=565073 RepID=A0A2V4NWW3_9ACTN|nr:hypothetical protein [Streptomyces tateyamensis]PYC81371.1 hypothetical protein C7C46_11710 [Streptomyces tateyamensis]
MLTLHRASTGPAVLVHDDRIAGLGAFAELAAAHPGARVRDWGQARLAAGRLAADAVQLLEHSYHPDPREEAGTDPVPLPADLADGHYGGLGGSARRGVQRLLAAGTTALVGPFGAPAVLAAVRRSGLPVVAAGAAAPELVVGGRADFAVLAVPAAENGPCLATVLAGRIVFRRR